MMTNVIMLAVLYALLCVAFMYNEKNNKNEEQK